MELWEAVGVTILLGPLETTVINLLYAMVRSGIEEITSGGGGDAQAWPGTAALLGLLLQFQLGSIMKTVNIFVPSSASTPNPLQLGEPSGAW